MTRKTQHVLSSPVNRRTLKTFVRNKLNQKYLCSDDHINVSLKEELLKKSNPPFLYKKLGTDWRQKAWWMRDLRRRLPTTDKEFKNLIETFGVKDSIQTKCSKYIGRLPADDKKILKFYTQDEGYVIINVYLRNQQMTRNEVDDMFTTWSPTASFLTPESIKYANKHSNVNFFTNTEFTKNTSKRLFNVLVRTPHIEKRKYFFDWIKQVLNYVLLVMRRAINNAPKLTKNVYLFRGNEDMFGDLSRGDVQRFQGFASYSYDPFLALAFATKYNNKSKTHWISRLMIPKGTPLLFLNMESVSWFHKEGEVLLPDGGTYINTKLCGTQKLYKFRYINPTNRSDEISFKTGWYVWGPRTSIQNSSLITNKLTKAPELTNSPSIQKTPWNIFTDYAKRATSKKSKRSIPMNSKSSKKTKSMTMKSSLTKSRSG